MKWTRFLDLERINRADEEELLNELYRQMFIVAYSKLNNKSDALDIVQESWLKILQKIDSLKDREKLFQWAKVIVSNTAANYMKKRHSIEFIPYQLEFAEPVWPGADLEIEERFLRRALVEGISQLDDETGQMIICKYYYGWKDKDIAEVMDFPVGTVKARIHRAKDRLRVFLSEREQSLI